MLLVLSAAAFLFAYFILGWSWWLSSLWAVGGLALLVVSSKSKRAERTVQKVISVICLLVAPLMILDGGGSVALGSLREGILWTTLGMGLAAVGSHNVWIEPKKRSKLWLLFPILLPGVGYIPLAILSNKNEAK